MYNGEETIQFAEDLPAELVALVCKALIQVDGQEYTRFIKSINATLRSAADPWYGLLDNFLTNTTFQLWPILIGTHYQRVRNDANLVHVTVLSES